MYNEQNEPISTQQINMSNLLNDEYHDDKIND